MTPYPLIVSYEGSCINYLHVFRIALLSGYSWAHYINYAIRTPVSSSCPKSTQVITSVLFCLLQYFNLLLAIWFILFGHLILQYSSTIIMSMMLHSPLPNTIPILTLMLHAPTVSSPYYPIVSSIPCRLDSCISRAHQGLSQKVEAVHGCCWSEVVEWTLYARILVSQESKPAVSENSEAM